jgi:hypothetical protein
MPRELDEKKTRKAKRILRRVAERAEVAPKPLTDWEKAFVQGVSERLETYGSAFRDPTKGRLEDALSVRQAHVVRQLDKKTRAGASPEDGPGGPEHRPVRNGLKRKSPLRARRPVKPSSPPEDDPPPRPVGPPRLRAIKGGKK